jgi:hypothetical protein
MDAFVAATVTPVGSDGRQIGEPITFVMRVEESAINWFTPVTGVTQDRRAETAAQRGKLQMHIGDRYIGALPIEDLNR